MSKYIIRQVSSGVKFDLRSPNGQTIATSEVYESMAYCRKGIESVRKNVPAAKLEDQTEGAAVLTNPKFELFRDKQGAYRFRLRARNGKIIIFSEAYGAKSACEAGIEAVRRWAPDAETEEMQKADA